MAESEKQTNVDVRKWLTDLSKHCPECGSSNLASHEQEGKLKHRCLDCLVFFAERDLKEKP
jgi:ribosomal protein S27AE